MIEFKHIFPKERSVELIAIGKKRIIKTGEYFLREGTVPKSIAYINSGLFRYVYITDTGVEYTKGIISEGLFLASYSSMITQTNSHFYIEALEDAEIIEIPYAKLQKLVESDIFWTKFMLKMVEKGFGIKEKREREFLLLDAETRYLNFLREFPHLEKRVKQIVIASYLGIHPESLSRIKKKIRT